MFDPLVKLTPMMEQWKRCKQDAKEALLLFRMGDFYEAFYEDAEIIATSLDLTLTKRQEIPMCGVPWHTVETHIDRLVVRGFKVAIAEQVEDPKKAKGLVERKVVRIVTQGTVINSSLLSEKSNNYIASICQVGSLFGLGFLDLTCASFQTTELDDEKQLFNELLRLRPSELVVSKKFQEKHKVFFREWDSITLSIQDEELFDHKHAYRTLSQHLEVHHLDGCGLKGKVAAINAAGSLLLYLQEELALPLSHIRTLTYYSTQATLLLDQTTERNLELIESESGRKNTLLSTLDYTATPMGARFLRNAIQKPLLSVEEILKRQESVDSFCRESELRCALLEELRSIRDLERLTMKISSGMANPRDLVSLRNSLEKIAPIKNLLSTLQAEKIRDCGDRLHPLEELRVELQQALVDEPPLRISEGHLFQEGYNVELDQLRKIASGGKEWLVEYQNQIKEESGIKNLKITFNRIYGYSIEVSKGQAHLMPSTFQRLQTLVNAERFTSTPLKEYESRLFSAEETMRTLEMELFQKLRLTILQHEKILFEMAHACAEIDFLVSLAEAAKRHHYIRPVIDGSDTLEIIGGRHPIVEVSQQFSFIPNDTHLNKKQQLMLITGPNMAGKSTYLRQVALIVILAQMGSFVPATRAHIGVIDKIFTRIGASDNLSRRQSTFMIEMSETANILNNATSRSLVILDEIGRGTSTYDGLSIAWSVAEYLLKEPNKLAKTLFATHYWELTELENRFPQVVNFHASVKEMSDEILFLHKIERGAATKSYGIHVAKLAGLPRSVITRASTLLKRLESRKESPQQLQKEKQETQLTFF